MLKKITLVIFGLLIFIVVLNFISNSQNIKKIYINNQLLNIEIADKEDKRTRGLSGRSSLANNYGMLFIFPEAGFHSFWMKDMHFPLDFVWINGEKVVDLRENVLNPLENTPDSELPMFTSKTPADKVLEVNAGTVKSLNIKVGDKLDL